MGFKGFFRLVRVKWMFVERPARRQIEQPEGPGRVQVKRWLGEREQELWGGEEDRGLGSVLK